MKRKTLLALVIGLIGMFAFAGCGKKATDELVILVHMLRAQQQYFENTIIPEFEKKYNCKVRVVTVQNFTEMKKQLELDAAKANPEISLVKTPFEITHQLVNSGYVQKLSNIVDRDVLAKDMTQYHDVASALGVYNGEHYYIPRKLETRILFYRKSMVKEALDKFEIHEAKLNELLKEMNGYGLPNGYVLESDPSEWDFYDLFTVGYIWANDEANKNKSGKIAHRADKYGGTGLFFVDRMFQMGASADDILALRGDAVAETFLWEKAFLDAGLYNNGMWNDKWRGDDIYGAVKSGKAYLAYFQQIDCFNVHGWEGDASMQSYLQDPSDMGLAMVPKAVSFTLDADGKPAFEGTRRITTGGWWWGVATKAPKAGLAYEFATFITNRTWNAYESSRFGMVPVRKDLLLNISETYELGWVGDIYKTSVMQIKQQLADSITIVPRVEEYPQISNNIIDAWYSMIDGANKDVALNKDAIVAAIEKEFAPKAKSILGDAYPAEPVKEAPAEEAPATEEAVEEPAAEGDAK